MSNDYVTVRGDVGPTRSFTPRLYDSHTVLIDDADWNLIAAG